MVVNLKDDDAFLNEVTLQHALPAMPVRECMAVCEFRWNICQSVEVSYVYSYKYGG